MLKREFKEDLRFFNRIRGTHYLLNSSNVFGAGDCVSDWSSPPANRFSDRVNGVDFGEAYADKEEFELERLLIPFLSKGHLIQNKESTGREKDKLDARQLKEHLGQ